MRVAFISLMRAFPWGGSEELWFRAAKLAMANGHTVCTLTQRWQEVPTKITELEQLGAEVYFYEAARHSLAARVAVKLSLKPDVADIIPEVKADVYVLSNGSTWDFIYNHPLTNRLIGWDKPYVLISQHNFENGHTVKDTWRAYALKFIKGAENVFFVSARNLQVAERQLGYAIEKAQVISNPVIIKSRSIKPFPASPRLLMACVARLDCDFKGQDILLQVLSTAQWRERDFYLKLYGSGPHRAHLQQLITLYKLEGKVSLEGQVSDIDHIWETNHVLVLPSLSEGTPLALIEAMLSGRAAVTTDVGGNSEYVRDGETGFLAATASVSCLTASLESLWDNRHKLQTMGETAFKHAAAITDFCPEKTLFKYIQQADTSLATTKAVKE
ncbi:glycosyltransferase family 4 protein [Hymenobacter sp. BT559]|uniref:glycosyltransferase family 4 protein n=1 Tax=Hymenobacter sp. BT559 TaxID=2795729 RepID=UPI0018EDE8F9|nr:glycosyltransferase family 4 protein [Hymenobacter sp. BT559]MBJ6141845.1 glycosyltransferase family 4 protein [Hymenobacter sp. BT559]